MSNIFLKVLSMLLPVSICSCASNNSWQKEKSDVEACVYRFGDSSLPPQYHRSYTIAVMKDKIEVSIDCYGKTLLKKTYNVARLDSVIEQLSTMDICIRKEHKDDGCSGGTTETLTIRTAEKVLLNGWVYHCGGDDYGTLDVKSGRVAEAFHKVLPEKIQKLIDSTLERDEE